MPIYIYKAKKTPTENVTGQIVAHTQDEAVDLITQLGFVPISVDIQADEKDKDWSKRAGSVSIKEINIFSQQLAALLKSGIAILTALEIIRIQTSSPYFKHVIGQVAKGVKNGRAFSDCLGEFPRIFSQLYVMMVYAGENSSNLKEMLLSMSNYQKRQAAFMSRVRMAMIYPLFMAVVGAGTITFILTVVLPKMMGLFKNLRGGLPLPTKIVLSVSWFFTHYWYVLILGFLAGYWMVRKMMSSAEGQMIFGRFVLNIPVWGDLYRKAELARFCRTVNLLLKNGIALIQAIKISAPVLNSAPLKKQLQATEEVLTAGGTWGTALKKMEHLPVMMGYMISVGEETGNLSDVLADVADYYEQEVDEKVKMTTTVLEPLMILIVGLVVGTIVFAILLPIFQVDVFAA
ncbi:MAG: type II secretion system F family protein [Candidatus Omnitrophica bacterium]|nr:type II secretion system F family protein [Candidatus Omnitrophota bacterium]